MRNLFLFIGILLGYTFIYAGLSHFGLSWFASPGTAKPASNPPPSGGGSASRGKAL